MSFVHCEGWWEQAGFGRQVMEQLQIEVDCGNIRGSGNDIIGMFTLTGTIDDGSYPSTRSAYLATICFYMCLFNADPTKVEYTGELSADVVKKLRSAATDTLKHR